MNTCPNCGHEVAEQDNVCPTCGFNLKKYHEDFFVKEDTDGKPVSRKAYRKETKQSKSDLPNNVMQKMITWIHVNSTIVFLLGVFLLIVMSFSRSLGWIAFFALLVWLFIVCDRADKIERYTADQRLTEQINQTGSHLFNSVEENSQKFRSQSKKFQKSHPKVEDHVEKVKEVKTRRFSYIQLSVVLTAFISLIVLFSGSGAAVAGSFYSEKMSISKVLLSLAGRLISSGQTAIYALIFYLVWLLLIVFPIVIIYNVFKNTKKSQWISFIFSLIETVFLIYIIFKMSSSVRASTGIFKQLTSQLITYAVSVGASTYFLILASVMTTGLSGYNLFNKNHRFDEK